MSSTKPEFFASDRLPRWRSALTGAAIWLRMRFRHNPGFAIAAVTGSIGLALALFLLLGGGMQYFGKKADDAEVAAKPSLGAEADEIVSDHKSEPPVKTLEVSQIDDIGRRAPVSVKGKVDPFLDAEAIDDGAIDDDAARAVSARTPSPRPKPIDIDDEPLLGADEPVVHEKAEEEPLLTQSEPAEPAKTETIRLGGREESDSVEPDDEKPVASQPAASQPLFPDDEPLVSDSSAGDPGRDDEAGESNSVPVAQPQPSVDESDVAAGEAVEEEPVATETETVVTAPVAKPADSLPATTLDAAPLPSRPKWKNTTPKLPRAEIEPAPTTGQQSQAVETAVYAAPETKVEAPPSSTRVGEPQPDVVAPTATLELAMRGPGSIAAGQSFDIEFTVTNPGESTISGALLSVALPSGLSHPNGPELERRIDPLAAGQTQRVRLRVKATATGEMVPRADIAVRGKFVTRTETKLRVGSHTGAAPSMGPCPLPPVRYIW